MYDLYNYNAYVYIDIFEYIIITILILQTWSESPAVISPLFPAHRDTEIYW